MDLDDLGTDPLISPEAQAFIDRCRRLAEEDATEFASDTLHGIADSVEATGHMTLGQINAVDNIVDGARRHERSKDRLRGGGSRRYEGWKRG